MALQAKLLNNYQAELRSVQHMKAEGLKKLESSIWDFSGEHEDDSLIPIDEVIAELERRIGVLSNPECSAEEVESLNY